MRSLRPFTLLLATFVVHLSLATTVLAAGADATAIKARADAAFDGKNYVDALAAYQEALDAGHDPRMHYNIAQTLSALERYPEALESYQRFLSEAPPGTLTAAQQERFFALLDELKAKIARFELTCDVAGARVLVRDKLLGMTPLHGASWMNAGPATVEVFAEGFRPYRNDVTLTPGTKLSVDVTLERVDFTGGLVVRSAVPDTHVLVDGAEKGTAPVTLRLERGSYDVRAVRGGYADARTKVSVETGAHREVDFSPVRLPDYTLAYVGFGVGAAGVITGTVTGILAFTTVGTAKSQCDSVNKECGPSGQPDLDASRTYGVLSSVALGVAAVGTGFGVYAWVRARHGNEAPHPVVVSAWPGGLRLGGAF